MTVEIEEEELRKLRWTAERADLLDAASGVGLWQAILVNADAMHPDSEWTWSPEFRRLIGYSSEAEFPNVVGSWADKLHPDDVEATFAAFAGHLEDRSGRASYDVTYRLKMRSGEYRWFRATGGCHHMPDGQIRACGSLCDVHEAVMLQQRIERDAVEDSLAFDQIAEALGRFSKGDMTVQITGDVPSKMSRLKDDFNASVVQLRKMIGMMKKSVIDLDMAVKSMREDSSALSMRSANQAASLEQTSAAVVEITSTVKQSADLAQKSSKTAQDSRERAVSCSEVVQKSIAKMSEIEESSGKIGTIIGTIEDIAFQTNMLALNAAVEAARAGDAGRGFAVVAAEVRSLAQRSSDSVREITDLIMASKGHVTEGVALVKNTGDAIEEISGEAGTIADAVQGISDASQEQAMALSDIERSITQLDDLTQKNAQMSQQNEGTANTLADTLGQINKIIGRFRTSDNIRGQHAAA